MNTREVTNQYRLNKWTEIVRDCHSSGQTISAWCADHDINPKTYYYWLRRVRAAACEALPSLYSQNNPITNPFVPVNIPVSTAGADSGDQEVLSDFLGEYKFNFWQNTSLYSLRPLKQQEVE
ncbi:transposase [Paenibacillus sp.]|uniref:IS66 family insertion sequence element accessory protein TnpA n=1 Tax=Paenibacillus sp. TaxID=58172 RepID=UPI00356A8FF4